MKTYKWYFPDDTVEVQEGWDLYDSFQSLLGRIGDKANTFDGMEELETT